MAWKDWFKGRSAGRKPNAPSRDTISFPQMMQIGQAISRRQLAYKPSPRNLRYFSRTPYARAAINAIKNPLAELGWKIVTLPGVTETSEHLRQIEVATNCLLQPNQDDSFRTLIEQVVEDICVGAGAIELQTGGDALRPLWLWPVDGLSIQIYPAWAGEAAEPRYVQTVGYGSAAGGGQAFPLRNDELMYIRPNPSTSTPFGYGPLEIAFNSIARMLGVGEFAGNVATNSRPSIMLDLGDGVTDTDIQTFRAYWKNEVEGQGVMPIVGLSQTAGEKSRGASVERLYPEGDDGLYLKYQEFLKAEIAISFGLSPQNLGAERDINRNTAEVAEDRDWNGAIKPMAHLIGSHLTREAIQGKLGFSQLMFMWVGLEREDELNTAKIYEIYYKNNAITPDEQRARLGQPPSEGPWGELVAADVEIAIQAARGAGQVDDPDLKQPDPQSTKPKPGKVKQKKD
ncbi:phage portal protein [Rhizobium lusitanum]|uniref:phage portal protein n=1 Tax=Rhizobium lusitanum TaxID=293958 RepID=UPI00195D7751|nr:phage portal protein [Rhizobium lusitanum]MBM7045430.1 phage portal protein [Rhizobium lusitanum]